MIDTNPTIRIITLNMSNLNASIKDFRVGQKTRPANELSIRNPP